MGWATRGKEPRNNGGAMARAGVRPYDAPMGSMRSTWGAPAYGKRKGRGLRSKTPQAPQYQPGAPLNEQTARDLQQRAGNKATNEAAKKAAALEQIEHERKSKEETTKEHRKLSDSELQEMMAKLADSPYGVSREDTELLAANGYKPGAMHQPAGGLAYRTFIPLDGGDAVVAFKRLALKRDMSDMGSRGAKDLLAKVEATEAPLKNLVQQHGPFIVTGQDSGGGAAQLVEATHTNMVSDIATFNSPNIDSDAIAKLATKDDKPSEKVEGDKSPGADGGSDDASTAGKAEDERGRDATKAAAANDTANKASVDAKAEGSPTEQRAARAAASIMGVPTEDRAEKGAESQGAKESEEQHRVEAEPTEKAAKEQDEKTAEAGAEQKDNQRDAAQEVADPGKTGDGKQQLAATAMAGADKATAEKAAGVAEDVKAAKEGIDSRDATKQEADKANDGQAKEERAEKQAEKQEEAEKKVTSAQDKAAEEKQAEGQPGAASSSGEKGDAEAKKDEATEGAKEKAETPHSEREAAGADNAEQAKTDVTKVEDKQEKASDATEAKAEAEETASQTTGAESDKALGTNPKEGEADKQNSDRSNADGQEDLRRPEEAAEREVGEKHHQTAANEVKAENLVEKAQQLRNEVTSELREAWEHIIEALRRGESVQSQEEIINLCEVSDIDAGVLLEHLHRLHDMGNA